MKKYNEYMKLIKNAKTKAEIKDIIGIATNDNDFEDTSFDNFIYDIAPIIEEKLGIKIDNFEETDTGLFQKIIDLQF